MQYSEEGFIDNIVKYEGVHFYLAMTVCLPVLLFLG